MTRGRNTHDERKRRGHRSRRTGANFEAEIQAQAGFQGGRILLIKQQETTRPTRYRTSTGAMLSIVTGKGWADWVGAIQTSAAPLFITFETKTTTNASGWTVDPKLYRGGSQWTCLERAHRMNAPAFVLVRRFRDGALWSHDDYLIPVGELTFTSRVWSRLERFKMPHSRSWWDACLHWSRYLEEGWQNIPAADLRYLEPDPEPKPEPAPGQTQGVCEYCGKTFVRRSVGRPKKVCSATCRKALWRVKKRAQEAGSVVV